MIALKIRNLNQQKNKMIVIFALIIVLSLLLAFKALRENPEVFGKSVLSISMLIFAISMIFEVSNDKKEYKKNIANQEILCNKDTTQTDTTFL